MSCQAAAPNTDLSAWIIIEIKYRAPLISQQGSRPEHPRSHSQVPPDEALLEMWSQHDEQRRHRDWGRVEAACI